MRRLLLVTCLVLGLPWSAAAQTVTDQNVRDAGAALGAPQLFGRPLTEYASMPGIPVARAMAAPLCCNGKGALIGAAIGVGAGLFLTRMFCDAHECDGAYVGASALYGMLGGALGAFTPSPRIPLPWLPARSSARIAPSVSVRF